MANHPRNTFYFGLQSGRELCIAITALADPELNPTRLGRIDVDAWEGFEISVFNRRTAAAGHLLIKPSDFQTYFQSHQPIGRKIVDLAEIAHNFNLQNDMSDELTVFHVAGSDRITFLLTGHLSTPDGEEFRAREFHAECLRNIPVIRRFPMIDRFCMGTLDSDDLELITESFPEIVFCDIRNNIAILDVHSMDDAASEIYKRLYLDDPEVSEELEYAWFKWRYFWVLQILSALAATYNIYIVRERAGNIIIRFTLARDPHGAVEFLLGAMNFYIRN